MLLVPISLSDHVSGGRTTISTMTAIALRRHVVEDPGELLEVGYFAPHVGEVFERHQFGLLEETVGDVGPSGRQKNAGTAPWAPAGSRPALEQWQPLGEREHLDLTFLERLRHPPDLRAVRP